MKQQKMRRALLILPLLVYPFLCLLFFVAHSVSASNGKVVIAQGGVNTTVPEPAVEAKPVTKMSLYDRAHADSEGLSLSGRMDSRALNLDLSGNDARRADPAPVDTIAGPTFLTATPPFQDKSKDAVARAQQQLAALQRQVELVGNESAQPKQDLGQPDGENAQVARLEKMMQLASASANEPDSELLQLDGMLDKILQIQHPELMGATKDTAYRASRQRLAQRVSRLLHEDFDQQSPIDSAVGIAPAGGRFYDLDRPEATASGNAFSAIVAAGAAVTDGAQLSMILMEDMVISGRVIAKGKTLYGVCKLGDQRVYVTVTSILDGKIKFPVNLVACGLDGQPGIPSSEAVSSETLKGGSGSMISSLDIGTMDPSLGAQAANAGIQTAKAFLSKKIRTVKANVPAQYPLLLVDESMKN